MLNWPRETALLPKKKQMGRGKVGGGYWEYLSKGTAMGCVNRVTNNFIGKNLLKRH